MDRASHVGRAAGPAGRLVVRHHHAARATHSACRAGRADRRGSGAREPDRGDAGVVRPPRAIVTRPGRRPRLQPVLVGPGQLDGTHVTDRGSAGWTGAGQDTRRPGENRRGPHRAGARRLGTGGPQRRGTLRAVPTAAPPADRLQQPSPDLADARPGRHPHRDDPQRAGHPARRPSTRRRHHPSSEWRFAGTLGGRHARRRDDELQRHAAVSGLGDPPASGRAVHAHRREHHRLAGSR